MGRASKLYDMPKCDCGGKLKVIHDRKTLRSVESELTELGRVGETITKWSMELDNNMYLSCIECYTGYGIALTDDKRILRADRIPERIKISGE